jgi:hypothetical protein
VLARHPKAKVLYISGYTDDAVLRNGVLHSENELLQKPFKADDLLHKVREILDRSAGGSANLRRTYKPTGSQSPSWSEDPRPYPEEACLETAS